MIISRGYANRLIARGDAEELGTVVSDGYRWLVINRLDLQRTDHVRMDRA